MMNNQDDDIEIIYWGEDEDDDIVNSEAFKKHNKRKPQDDFNWKKEAFSWVRLVLIAIIFTVAINKLVIINATVPTSSMEQTIHVKSRMMGFRLSYLFSKPERGDIIIFRYPDNLDEDYVKRVIALPGEYVEIQNGKVYINDELLEENYVYYNNGRVSLKGDFTKTLVPDGCYFVLGDNRNNSNDSRFWTTTHFVKEDLILGEALFTYYPKIKLLK